MAITTLLGLRDASKQRADMVNASFVSDSEWNSYINQSYLELYDLIIQKYGNDYYVKLPRPTFVTNGTDEFYPLPADFYKLRAVDLSVTSNSPDSWLTLKTFTVPERNRFSAPNAGGYAGRWGDLQYRLLSNQLWLQPLPSSGQTLRLTYAPVLTQLVSDGDLIDPTMVNQGWTEYIIIDAAIKAGQKEETDVGFLSQQKQAMITRIESAAENRDAANPQTVSDSRRNSGSLWDSSYGWDGNGSGGW